MTNQIADPMLEMLKFEGLNQIKSKQERLSKI